MAGVVIRAAERWVWWDRGPSQIEILAATFGKLAKIAADNKWLPAKKNLLEMEAASQNCISVQKCHQRC